MRRITVGGQPRQIIHETVCSKTLNAKWTGGVAQAVERLLCEIKPQCLRKIKERQCCWVGGWYLALALGEEPAWSLWVSCSLVGCLLPSWSWR
jgi:hypothetical protein